MKLEVFFETERRNVGTGESRDRSREIAARAQSALAGVVFSNSRTLAVLYNRPLCYRHRITALYCKFSLVKSNVFHYGTSYIGNPSF